MLSLFIIFFIFVFNSLLLLFAVVAVVCPEAHMYIGVTKALIYTVFISFTSCNVARYLFLFLSFSFVFFFYIYINENCRKSPFIVPYIIRVRMYNSRIYLPLSLYLCVGYAKQKNLYIFIFYIAKQKR